MSSYEDALDSSEDVELLYAKLSAEFEQKLAELDAQKGLSIQSEDDISQNPPNAVVKPSANATESDVEPTAQDFLRHGRILEYQGHHKEAIQHFMYCLDNPQDLSAEQLTEALASMGRICEFHHLTDQAMIFKNAERLVYEQQLLLLSSLESVMDGTFPKMASQSSTSPDPSHPSNAEHSESETSQQNKDSESISDMESAYPYVGPPPISSVHYDPNMLTPEAADVLPQRIMQQLQIASQYAKLGEMLLKSGNRKGAETYISRSIDGRRAVCGRFGVRNLRQITKAMLLAAEVEEDGREEYEKEIELYRLGKNKNIPEENSQETEGGDEKGVRDEMTSDRSRMYTGSAESRLANLTAELEASLAEIQSNDRRRGKLVREIKTEMHKAEKQPPSISRGQKDSDDMDMMSGEFNDMEKDLRNVKGPVIMKGNQGYDSDDDEDIEWSDIEDTEDTKFFKRVSLHDAGIDDDVHEDIRNPGSGKNTRNIVEIVQRTDDGGVHRKEYKRGGPVTAKDMLSKIKQKEEKESEVDNTVDMLFYQKQQLIEIQRLMDAKKERDAQEKDAKHAANPEKTKEREKMKQDLLAEWQELEMKRKQKGNGSGDVITAAGTATEQAQSKTKRVQFSEKDVVSSYALEDHVSSHDSDTKSNVSLSKEDEKAQAALRAFMSGGSEHSRKDRNNVNSLNLWRIFLLAFTFSVGVVSVVYFVYNMWSK